MEEQLNDDNDGVSDGDQKTKKKAMSAKKSHGEKASQEETQ